jgi:hypothetical protein
MYFRSFFLNPFQKCSWCQLVKWRSWSETSSLYLFPMCEPSSLRLWQIQKVEGPRCEYGVKINFPREMEYPKLFQWSGWPVAYFVRKATFCYILAMEGEREYILIEGPATKLSILQRGWISNHCIEKIRSGSVNHHANPTPVWWWPLKPYTILIWSNTIFLHCVPHRCSL